MRKKLQSQEIKEEEGLMMGTQLGHTHPFTPSIFCCMNKYSLLDSFLVSKR